MGKYRKHLEVIMEHKKEVFRLSIIAGIPLQGIMHDLSKFSPIEFLESAKYCNGTESPILVCKRENGYSMAWQHHKAHNLHHWEYWLDDFAHGGKGLIIPYKYCVEMGIDIISANKTYNKGHWKPQLLSDYWKEHRNRCILHPQILKFMDQFFEDYVKYGDLALKKEHTQKLYMQLVTKTQKKGTQNL